MHTRPAVAWTATGRERRTGGPYGADPPALALQASINAR